LFVSYLTSLSGEQTVSSRSHGFGSTRCLTSKGGSIVASKNEVELTADIWLMNSLVLPKLEWVVPMRWDSQECFRWFVVAA
jgi:hypothetical protein